MHVLTQHGRPPAARERPSSYLLAGKQSVWIALGSDRYRECRPVITNPIHLAVKPANRIGDTATCLRGAGEMIRDNVLYVVVIDAEGVNRKQHQWDTV
jgi:hypothetical protein